MKSLICVLVLSAVATGQLGRLEECLPIPSFGSELNQYREEARNRNASLQVQIRQVSFETQNYLPQAVKDQLASALMNRSYDSDSDWLSDIAERARYLWQEHGYFKALVSGSSRRLETDGANQRFAVLIVVNEGHQYKLGEISFSPSSVFTISELRSTIPLQTGAIFNITKVRDGLDSVRKLYGSKGYISFTAVPDFKIDESNGTISLKITLDEGKMYRISEIIVLGVDRSLAARHLQKWKLTPGNPYNFQLVEKWFREDKSIIPSDAHAESDMITIRNDAAGTVSLVFDFRRCPGTPSRAAISQKP